MQYHYFLEANRRKGLNDIPSPTTTNFRFKSGRLEFDDDALSIECSLKNKLDGGPGWCVLRYWPSRLKT